MKLPLAIGLVLGVSLTVHSAEVPTYSKRDQDLLAIAVRSGTAAAFRHIDQNFPLPDRLHARGWVMGEVGKLDLNVLLTYADAISDLGTRQTGYVLAADHWLAKDPAAFEAFVAARPDGATKHEILVVGSSVCLRQQRWDLGAKFAEGIPKSDLRRDALSNLGHALAVKGPENALQWSKRFSRPEDREAVEQGIILALTVSADFAALDTIIPLLSSPLSRGNALSQLGQMAQTKGVPISGVLEKYRERGSAVVAILVGAYRTSTKPQLMALLPHVEALANPTDRAWGFGEFAGKLFDLDQNEARQFVLSKLRGDAREEAIQKIVRQWFMSEAEKAVAWVDSLPTGKDQDTAFTALVGLYRARNQERAKETAARISDESVRTSLLRTFP